MLPAAAAAAAAAAISGGAASAPASAAHCALPIAIADRALQLGDDALEALRTKLRDEDGLTLLAWPSVHSVQDGAELTAAHPLCVARAQRMAARVARPETRIEARALVGVFDALHARAARGDRGLAAIDPTGAFYVVLKAEPVGGPVPAHRVEARVAVVWPREPAPTPTTLPEYVPIFRREALCKLVDDPDGGAGVAPLGADWS